MQQITDKKKLLPIINKLKENCTERKKKETFSVQLSIKGYDFQKDARFNQNHVLPHYKRFREDICVVGGDEKIENEAKRLNLPFKHFNDLTGNSAEKNREKKKLGLKYDAFIIYGRFAKHFNIKYVVQKRKIFFLLSNPTELEATVEKAKKTIQFKLRKNPDICFPIGTSEMTSEEIAENYESAINGLIGLLKKGSKNLKTITVKTNQSEPVNLL